MIWTKHFSQFIAYTIVQAPKNPALNVSGSGSGSAHLITVLLNPTPQNPQTPEIEQAPIKYQFTRYLQFGDRGADVKQLQIFLNNHDFALAEEGAGSPGNETEFFGPLTKQAVINFQETNIEKILNPWGLKKGTGVFYTYTMREINSILLN